MNWWIAALVIICILATSRGGEGYAVATPDGRYPGYDLKKNKIDKVKYKKNDDDDERDDPMVVPDSPPDMLELPPPPIMDGGRGTKLVKPQVLKPTGAVRAKIPKAPESEDEESEDEESEDEESEDEESEDEVRRQVNTPTPVITHPVGTVTSTITPAITQSVGGVSSPSGRYPGLPPKKYVKLSQVATRGRGKKVGVFAQLFGWFFSK